MKHQEFTRETAAEDKARTILAAIVNAHQSYLDFMRVGAEDTAIYALEQIPVTRLDFDECRLTGKHSIYQVRIKTYVVAMMHFSAMQYREHPHDWELLKVTAEEKTAIHWFADWVL